MEKQKKWRLFLIFVSFALTVYNILPTCFYYLKPLKQPIEVTAAREIQTQIEKRVNALESEGKEWLLSFCKLLQITPLSVSTDPHNFQLIRVNFSKSAEAARLRQFLPRSASLIPFAPAQMSLAAQGENNKEVLVQRQIPVSLDPSKDFFTFTSKRDPDGSISPHYREVILDRAAQIGYFLSGPTEGQKLLSLLKETSPNERAPIEALASQINTYSEIFEEMGPLASRFMASFTHGAFSDRLEGVRSLVAGFDRLRDEIKKEKTAAQESSAANPASEESLRQLRLLESKESRFIHAEKFVKAHEALFTSGQDPWSLSEIKFSLKDASPQTDLQTFSLGNRNSFFSDLLIDWAKEEIRLKLYSDLTEPLSRNKEIFKQLLINEIAKLQSFTHEVIQLPAGANPNEYPIALHELSDSSGLLLLNLKKIAQVKAHEIQSQIESNWYREHPDLQEIPIVDFIGYQNLPQEQKALCLIVGSPPQTLGSLRGGSIYVIAKGFEHVFQNYQLFPSSELAAAFQADFQRIDALVSQNGFEGYRGSALGIGSGFEKDYIFEKGNPALPILAASREDFAIRGTKEYATLELSNVEQRLIATNQIEAAIHEDLIKWKDEYDSAQVSLNPALKYDVPKPTRSVFWSNLNLTLRKLFRGDEGKIIHWGLDLSGGKTVQIELRDAGGDVVKNEEDLRQGINELYDRVNKMGVSEVSIRQIGHQIVLDFPSSQSIAASELIKASSMYFHVVNEKFTPHDRSLGSSVNRFLQEVWNEAVVTNRTDPQNLNAIAWKHLYGDSLNSASPQPQSEAARTLLENGLKLQSPRDSTVGNQVDDSLSKIALFRGSDPKEWHGQTHPLLFVFRNWALEGSQLDQIRSNYDPSKGNYLSFEVRSSSSNREGEKISPRQSLHAWTSQFSKEQVIGTPKEAHSQGRGWRMAVILNDTVISAPTLDSPLESSAMISGSFSQREVSQLAADLKAGSLTFTPHILSEKNVSPELGAAERLQGITATFVALLLVIGAMVLYYRFAGLIASIAVLFNLLMIWATLQNLGAALSLAGIAGIILNIGMAVDANVLVFERIKEEFGNTQRIASAISAGYQKAYSAIIDSNVTTIIAALILLNFDAGPIKAFAVTLIIGIVSSMFTALFMTRTFFSWWVQNPNHKALNMANWIHAKKIDFLKSAKPAFLIAATIVLAGGYLVFANRGAIFGMDFTGGFSLNIEVSPDGSNALSSNLDQAFKKAGAGSHDFQIRQLSPSNHFRLLLGTSMEQPGKPFYQMPLENGAGQQGYSFEKNPRIVWVVNALKANGLSPTSKSLATLDADWTSMSGQMSDSMRNHALIGLLISFISIFIYLAFRFEYKFAAAAILCLLHDVLITLGLMGLLYALGVPLQIDLNTVAALMTIVGYSLNDTIIIFDRIREEMRLGGKKPLESIVNSALNATLSRTTITSGTTLLVLIALVTIGGASIFSFALVMTIGVFFGTLSSLYIASPLMLFFHKKEALAEEPFQ